MVDDTNPTSQFHPYQAPTDTPVAQRPPRGMSAVLERMGVRSEDFQSMRDRVKNLDVSGSISRARQFARSNPGMVLGALAAVVIGAGLLRRRGA